MRTRYDVFTFELERRFNYDEENYAIEAKVKRGCGKEYELCIREDILFIPGTFDMARRRHNGSMAFYKVWSTPWLMGALRSMKDGDKIPMVQVLRHTAFQGVYL